MPLSDKQKSTLREEAANVGVDPDDLIAEAEKQSSAPRGAPTDAGAPTAPKVFQYHLPFLRVFELRSSIGYPERIADDDMLCGEFLVKHGGAPNGGGSTPPASE